MYWKYPRLCSYCFRFLTFCFCFLDFDHRKNNNRLSLSLSLSSMFISKFNVWKKNQRQIVMFELICFSNFYLNTHFFIVSASSTLFLQFFPLSSSSPSFFTHPIVTFFHSFHFSVFSPSPIIFVVLNYALHGFIGFSLQKFFNILSVFHRSSPHNFSVHLYSLLSRRCFHYFPQHVNICSSTNFITNFLFQFC